MKSFSGVGTVVAFSILLVSCNPSTTIKFDFDTSNERVWIGPDFWAVPLEDWKLEDNRVSCIGERSDMKLNIISSYIQPEGNFSVLLQMGTSLTGDIGSAGVQIAIQDKTDASIKSLCYFGKGIEIGVDGSGTFFIDKTNTKIPVNFDLKSFVLRIVGEQSDHSGSIQASIVDSNGTGCTINHSVSGSLEGMIALFCKAPRVTDEGYNFWYDNIRLAGSALEIRKEERFGPVLWTMYTLSQNILKMTVQMPPLGDQEKNVTFQINEKGKWNDFSSARIDPDSRIAVFRIENWDKTIDYDYRISYELDNQVYFYNGTIRREPVNGKLTMGAMTCQFHYGFPYSPLIENLKKMDPDILYFSGDQVYEQNGGYSIIRFPAEKAILNYLGKWYMFGWAFGDLMRDRPTIVIPDDHEVFQGNLWGAGGKKVEYKEWEMNLRNVSGFVEPAEMVQVVMETNSAHLPDPFDPEPMEQSIPVYYTNLVYAGVSFAIVGDRIFKSGPENVAWWEGRKDIITEPVPDPSRLDKEGLTLLGNRQMKFLDNWVTDWKDSYLKVLLSQTTFANAATHHSDKKIHYFGDLDSGGWPKSGRDEALKTIRKAFSFHLSGDQHLPTMIQYGLDEYRDAGWSFCTPAITVGFQRRFQPDKLNIPVNDRPEHNSPNTGKYRDVFGNLNYFYAVGNPDDETKDPNRYMQAQKSASGFAYLEYDTDKRTIYCDAIRFLSNPEQAESDNRFPGWPLTIKQLENDGRNIFGYLPVLHFTKTENPVIRVDNAINDELLYSLRISGRIFSPFVYENGIYSISYHHSETDQWIKIFEQSTPVEISSDTVFIDY